VDQKPTALGRNRCPTTKDGTRRLAVQDKPAGRGRTRPLSRRNRTASGRPLARGEGPRGGYGTGFNREKQREVETTRGTTLKPDVEIRKMSCGMTWRGVGEDSWWNGTWKGGDMGNIHGGRTDNVRGGRVPTWQVGMLGGGVEVFYRTQEIRTGSREGPA